MVGVVCVLILVSYLIVAFLSRKRDGPVFERMSMWLHDFLWTSLHIPVESRAVEKDLERLYPAASKEEVKEAYYMRKWELILKILLVGTLLCLGMKMASVLNGGALGEISREAVGQGDKSILVEATVGSENGELTLNVEERKLRKEEQELLLEECIKVIEQQLESGEWKNEEGDWNLPEYLSEYPFEILWRNGAPDELEAYFYYGEEMYRHTFFVSTEEGDTEEPLEKRLLREAEELNIATVYEDTYLLPAELDGVPVVWQEVSEDNSGIFFALMLLVAVAVYFLKDRDLHQEWNRKKLHMKVSYPMVLSKFVLYMGAGLTVRGCFLRIAAEGIQKEGETAGAEIYQEMFYAGQELNAGVSEGLVYERFGMRTGLEEYTRFTTMLIQNLKKGNAVLLERLKEECQKAQTENVHIRKRLGEEAQTKLLIPMVMMLGIVMLLVMIPAFSSL